MWPSIRPSHLAEIHSGDAEKVALRVVVCRSSPLFGVLELLVGDVDG